jgi:hypothetical protein
MHNRIFSVALALAAAAGAQPIPQRAAIVGGGNPNSGQCTITVLVDGQAEIEIRGSNATMRDLGGAPPQWRRFECTSAMPPNPANFQFAGLNGRGQQNLTAEPRNGGPAVVRIEDSEGGASEYTFRLIWSNYPAGQDRGPSAREDRGSQGDRGFDGNRDRQGDRRQDMDGYYNDRDAFFRGNNGRAMLFQRVRDDLNHATSGAFPFTGDRARLERTQMELDELQEKLARGFYDERELDETMAAMQAVVEGNRLSPRDRAMLTDDLNRMRDFRARHDDYGAHFGPGPDRRNFDQNRDGDQRFDNDGRGDNRRAMFFQHIREDLDRATSDASRFGGDRYRLARTRQQLDELQTKLSRGFYDERELNDVMGSLQSVVESSRLAPRDRDILAEDLRRLDDFRARHENYGAR